MRFFETLKNIWTIEELRKRLLITCLLVLIYRFGCYVVLPGISPADLDALSNFTNKSGLMQLLDMFSGGAFSQASIFALGIMPYITASIVIQLLGMVLPSFQKMQREGESGHQKLNQYTRYLTVLILLLQGPAYLYNLQVQVSAAGAASSMSFWTVAYLTVILAAGSMFIMWLGERITDRGIGNGISFIILVGIIARLPNALIYEFTSRMPGATGSQGGLIMFVVEIILLFAVTVGAVLLVQGTRKVPVQYAKRQVGRKMYGGQSSTLPMKVNMSGVLPVIFAQSIASLPITIWTFIGMPKEGTVSYSIYNAIDTKSVIYMVVYFIMIIGFSYFYSSIQFNPVEIANNLKKQGGFIPGFRPGQPTVQFIQKVLNRITMFGAIYLGIVAICPLIVGKIIGNSSLAIGGTSVIIVVGVALETVKALENQMLMRQYKGFLE